MLTAQSLQRKKTKCLTIKATTAGRGNKLRRFQMQEARMSQAEADIRPEQDSAEERFQVSVNIIQEMSGAQIRSKSGPSRWASRVGFLNTPAP